MRQPIGVLPLTMYGPGVIAEFTAHPASGTALQLRASLLFL
jgi:hypothetical protein